ncbi:MmcQ/YjbR family DNA-binding protein [Nakamurella leprariae]|uniref:MmcQ/YjbR family DNA-binding protein n=1 Tax=Nakamurella leprariae TaxID=2803911 RepID=A0A938YBK3_9ACTN|nr:MmcQ/YjbR family DNA-binding protein [Nakamurella leprariae]MBM9469501.1 MmcQ/YjbR family DNA-binding protein [Nakamurella leprariae]
MADLDDVQRLAAALPEVSESTSYGHRAWSVHGKAFVWERPLRRSDWQSLDLEPTGAPVLGVRVPDLADKDALIAENPESCFTTPHFDGHPAVLVWLDRVGEDLLAEMITDAWRVRAPKRLIRAAFPDENPGPS